MGMKMLFEDAREIAARVWLVQVAPHEVQLLGQPRSTLGTRGVLLAQRPIFDPDREELQVDANGVTLLNVGTGSETVVIAAESERARHVPTGDFHAKSLGPGDQEYLGTVNRLLSGTPHEAADRILREVRARYPGDLLKGKRLNFKNTPDNFWYVIVQPRVQSLSITVRGTPDRFEPSSLELKTDRPGYTRFIVDHPDKVKEALRIIELSKRK